MTPPNAPSRHPVVRSMLRRGNPALCVDAAHLVSVGLHGTAERPLPSPADIIHASAMAAGVDTGLLLSPNRTPPVVRARHASMLLLRRWLCMSYPEVKSHLHYRSHGGCIDGIRRAMASALGLGGEAPWVRAIVEAAARDLFGDAAHDAIALALPPMTRGATP